MDKKLLQRVFPRNEIFHGLKITIHESHPCLLILGTNPFADHTEVHSALYQYGGQCHTVHYSDEFAEGVQRGVWLVLNHVNCTGCGRHHWNIYVHSANDHYMGTSHPWVNLVLFRLVAENVGCQAVGKVAEADAVSPSVRPWSDWEHVWAPPRAQLEQGKEQNLKVKRMMEISMPSSTNKCNNDPSYSSPNVSMTALARTTTT